MFLAAESLEISEERRLIAAFDEQSIEVRNILLDGLVERLYVVNEFCG